jgi:hypothetical protein
MQRVFDDVARNMRQSKTLAIADSRTILYAGPPASAGAPQGDHDRRATEQR